MDAVRYRSPRYTAELKRWKQQQACLVCLALLYLLGGIFDWQPLDDPDTSADKPDTTTGGISPTIIIGD